jgi:hypothetical protein
MPVQQMSLRVASHELQGVLEIVVQQPKELQQLVAEALKQLPAYRYWLVVQPFYGGCVGVDSAAGTSYGCDNNKWGPCVNLGEVHRTCGGPSGWAARMDMMPLHSHHHSGNRSCPAALLFPARQSIAAPSKLLAKPVRATQSGAWWCRRWSGLLLPCYGLSGAASGGNLSLPVASRQLQRALRGVEQQPLEWQQQAAEALQEVMLGAR